VTFTTQSTAPEPGPSLGQNRLFQALLGGYLLLWIGLAISPIDRQDWLLENILAMVSVTLLIVTYRRFQFSDLSYVLIILFMILHAIGAHYTYSKVPLGYWLQGVMDLDRNHYDRLVHFAFGLLLAYPIYELVLRRAKARHGWALVLAASTIVGMSGFFEVLESWVAQMVSPELGTAYLGTQGDEWDAQKDATMAILGVVISLGFASLVSRSNYG
jgi:putative membrane protein